LLTGRGQFSDDFSFPGQTLEVCRHRTWLECSAVL
jgi:hypothetical protein